MINTGPFINRGVLTPNEADQQLSYRPRILSGKDQDRGSNVVARIVATGCNHGSSDIPMSSIRSSHRPSPGCYSVAPQMGSNATSGPQGCPRTWHGLRVVCQSSLPNGRLVRFPYNPLERDRQCSSQNMLLVFYLDLLRLVSNVILAASAWLIL